MAMFDPDKIKEKKVWKDSTQTILAVVLGLISITALVWILVK